MTTSLSMPVADAASQRAAGTTPLNAGYGVALTDAAAFEHAVARAGSLGVTVQPAPVQPPGQAMQALFKPLEHINNESAQLASLSQGAMDGSRSLTPGEMVSLTVKCHEFMFHCQLTANVANRTSDGLQQLFRQQS